MEQFIELNRIFYQIAAKYGHAAKSDGIDIKEALDFRIGKALNWNELLREYRVVILAEAGAGKTREIRNATQKLRAENKTAFFVRLENISTDIETAFEEGTYLEFQNWINSNNEGWLLLDSVDEARLKDPKDFERAIKKLSIIISPAIQRSHIVITSRITAWRPKSDLTICNTQFPYPEQSEVEVSKDELDVQISLKKAQRNSKKLTTSDKEEPGFKIWSIADLSKDQISVFVRVKGISEDYKFLEEIERQDAWAFTTRPQDLEEIVQFWNAKKRIGTRFELMRHSIERRIIERDQDRADSKPLPAETAKKGVQLLAAACTFMHQSTIRVPDGANLSEGIEVQQVMPDWDDLQCQILLSRPIFDEAIYGTVRFHHRSVREYLTAEWLFKKLQENGSRRKIEELFFREQYGLPVIVPSMRPVLSWLVLLDSKIMDKVYKLEPEIILEGGDPSKLPLLTRKEILKVVCEKIAAGTSSRSVDDPAAVQRFASQDIADDIKELLLKYRDNNSVVSYLLRMIWQGRIKQALQEVTAIASNSQTQNYTRISSIRALKSIGSNKNFDEFKEAFLLEEGKHDRRVLAEVIENLEHTEDSVCWILKALEKVREKEKYNVEGLTYSLSRFVESSTLDVAFNLIHGIDRMLQQEPFIERRFCEISERFGWLMPISIQAVEKLLVTRHIDALKEESLFVLTMMPSFEEYGDFDPPSLKNDISILVQDWKELNMSLFWKNVEETRKSFERKNDGPLTNFWQVSIFGRYWSFDKEDFSQVIEDITNRPLLDDRHVALSLAFQLYIDNKRPRKWLVKLKEAVHTQDDLKTRLELFLRPPVKSEEFKKLKKQRAQWARRNKAREKKRNEDHAKSVQWLYENFDKLRDNGLAKGVVSQQQYYLHNQLQKRRGNLSSKWATGNWKDLITDYGQEVAIAYRDGLVDFWRNYVPSLRSEKDTGNTTLFAIIFGLSALQAESTEIANWPANLNTDEAELACRYAFHELNDFPAWFPNLFEKFPDVINRLLLKEIFWELETATEKDAKHYILSKVSWSYEWLWDGIAPSLLAKVIVEPTNAEHLSYILNIVQKCSTISDEELREFAAKKCKNPTQSENIPYWFSAWIGVDPATAIVALSTYLIELSKTNETAAINVALKVVVCLVGEKRSRSSAREKYKTPSHLKDLYLLMHQYIRMSEDIDRSGKGVYSPNLRDDGQDARDYLFSMLRDIPGKESYLAMVELSASHPTVNKRNWMMQNAKERAQLDADLLPWTGEKFTEFNKFLESTPMDHRGLFYLAIQRILDLKYDLEEGDESIASTLAKENEERGIRKFIAGWCRDRASGRYTIAQEEELADARKPDSRFLSSNFDAPVPLELKLADNWNGPPLFERLENQLCGDYLRDGRSNCGIFVLVYRGEKKSWQTTDQNSKVNFKELVEALQNHWEKISANYPKIEKIQVIGIDLTKRIQTYT